MEIFRPIIKRITPLDNHYFFGFHDLIQSNKKNNHILCLSTNVISRPPLPNEFINVGYVDMDNENKFVPLGVTNAFNFPQGSRQQWIGDSDLFITNNQIYNSWGADIYDTNSHTKVASLKSPVHCLSFEGKKGFFFNYSRVQRLGGYGYVGISDQTENVAMPKDDGIFINEIESDKSYLLVSLKEVAESSSNEFDFSTHHYVTHLRLNQDNSKLAFLHRYFLADGGFMTRLMVIDVNGSNLICLGAGFLSHFDWLNNDEVIIYGRVNSSIDHLRSNYFFTNPVSKLFVRHTKKVLRSVLKFSSNKLEMSFLKINIDNKIITEPFALENLVEDGHPMVNPIYKKWLVNDTYPDKTNCRTLMLYNFNKKKRINLGHFCFTDKNVDMSLQVQFLKGIDRNVLKNIDVNKTSFFRSGLHCDLHPRWLSDGVNLTFDSIHEGKRQIYSINVKELLN